MAKKIRGRNEGSIWQQRGRWRSAITINGKRISRTFDSKSECQAWIREMQKQIDQGLTYSGAKISLEKFLTDWLMIHKKSIKPRTSERYEQISRDYIFPILGKYKLLDLRLEHIENLYHQLQQDGVSIRNVRLAHSVLHRSLRDAVRRGLVGFNASHGARQPKMTQKEMRFLDENQIMQFFISVRRDRNEALYHMAIKTGMRQGELLGIKWSDLDWNSGKLRIQRQVQRVPGKGRTFVPPKTRAGRRTIFLGNETLQLLRQHRSRQQLEKAIADSRWQKHDLIFPSRLGTPQSGSNLLKEFKALLKRAGLHEIRFHDLRHTAASMMLNNQVPSFVVSRILGHSKPSTTMDIYGHLIPAAYENVGDRMDELLTPVSIEVGEKSKTLSLNTNIAP